MRGVLGAVGLVVCASLGAFGPSVAKASGTCTYDASTHTVTMSGFNQVDLGPTGGIDGTACGAATVTNTDQINVTAGPGVLDVLDPALFAPSFSNPDSQIHFAVNFPGGNGLVDFENANSSDPVDTTVGVNGISFNSTDTVDMTVTGLGTTPQTGGIGMGINASATGTLSGNGGGALGKPTTLPLFIASLSPGATLIGGNGVDQIGAYAANETVSGGKGNDTLIIGPNTSNSVLDGGAGKDWLRVANGPHEPSYTISLDGVANDGALPGNATNNVLNVEDVAGGKGDDTLIGNDGNNVLKGGVGNDTITGGGGADHLIGGSGNDTFLAEDGVKDTVNGGSGTDTATVDCGLDTVISVETTNC